MVTATRTNGSSVSGFHLHFDAVRQQNSNANAAAVTSFNTALESLDGSEVDLAGLAGLLIDTDRLREADVPLCITIHDALRRHTPPKRITAATGAAAQHDLAGGTDGRISCETRYALFLWSPEIYNETESGVGTQLLHALRDFLSLDDHASVLVDFGVEDEQDGFVNHFYPRLRSLELKLSENGQFARGQWSSGAQCQRRSMDIGIVFL